MPLCLLCPTGNQPSFVEIAELTNHISEVHSNTPLSPVGRPPQLAPATQCCICNKKFTTPGGLLAHQKAKQHYPPRSASSPKVSSSERLAHQPETCGVSASSTTVNGNATTSHSDLVEQHAVHRCNECQTSFDSLAKLETHQSSHGKLSCSKCSYLSSSLVEWNNHFKQAHQKTQSNGRQAEFACDAIIPPSQRSPSLAVIRPTSPHVSSNSPGRGLVVCELCKKPFKGQVGLQAHMAAKHPTGAECIICHFICPSTAALEEHVDTVHSCARCGTRYQTEEERELHFAAADNYHPVCVACHLGFEDENALLTHMNLLHLAASPQHSPNLGFLRVSAEPSADARCDVCYEICSSQTELDVHVVTVHSCPICHDGIYMDMRELEEHLEQHRSPHACHSCGLAYTEEDQLLEHFKNSSSDVHPYCEKCQLGFENNDTYTAHGASAHPECHCYLCQWHFDTPEILQNHIKHFFNHPKCHGCNIRFADADAYQYHLFIVHRPRLGDQGQSGISAIKPDRENKISHDELSSPSSGARAFDPVWGFEGSANLPYASFIPLPPSLSESHSRSSTLTVEQHSPIDGPPWDAIPRSISLDIGEDLKASPEFDHSPLSTLPAVGTPLISSVPTIQSSDLQSPFSPRPEPPSLFSLSQGASGTVVTVAEQDDVDSNSSSSFTRSPPLISPVVRLPDPGVASTSPTSNWTTTSDTDSRRSSPHPRFISSSKGTNGTFSVDQPATSDRTVPQLSLLVPSSTHLTGSARSYNSGCLSSISPESAGISISASMTPDYLREARAYLSLTHQTQELPTRPIPQSPGISSPILSSTGLAIGERGRRREVRFEENIMLDSGWDSHSTSSDSALGPSVVHPRPNLKMNVNYHVSQLSGVRQENGPTARQIMYPPTAFNRRPNGTPSPSYHCRSCYMDHCEEPTTTTCGHLFCYQCISTAIMKDARCPVCEAPTLLYCLFRIDTSA
ncbi:hypothetical protein J3R82DRAFT_6593 [Butyriboletus roseoflavus]|nr:hypothetical protein J3R82DRAFT_6593 [Butyriboletus roseoflavus]